MDDLDAFERQVADVARRVVGPPRSIDAIAIARGARAMKTATRPRPALGALRFAAAGALLVLFGGFLVIGLSTVTRDEKPQPGVEASSEPPRSPAAEPTVSPAAAPTAIASLIAESATLPDVLPGVALVAEKVEPGVLRIVSDGVRELSRPTGLKDYDVFRSTIAAGLDGSVWILTEEGFFRVGSEPEHAWKGASFRWHEAPSIRPDGTLWQLDGDVLRSFDGTRWKAELRGANGFHMWPDGTIWTRNKKGHLLRLKDGTWTDMHVELGSELPRSAEGGQIWVSPRVDSAVEQDLRVPGAKLEVLVRHMGDDLEATDALGVGLISSGELAGGPAGALSSAHLGFVDMTDAGDWWIYQALEVPQAGSGSNSKVVHYLVWVQGGLATQVLTDEQGVPRTGHTDWGGSMEAAPDGSVWMTVGGGGGSGTAACDGVKRYNGERWSQFLRGMCVYDFDPAPDGSVWLQAAGRGVPHEAVETYVIERGVAMADG
jgi:hypothetical protein